MIPYTSTEDDIKALFSKFGEVKEVFLMTNKNDGTSKVCCLLHKSSRNIDDLSVFFLLFSF